MQPFALPALECFAEVNPGLIELRIIYRDASPEIMNNHLTHGARAIPKVLIADDSEGILWTWGPRPSTLQNLVKEWLSEWYNERRETQKSNTMVSQRSRGDDTKRTGLKESNRLNNMLFLGFALNLHTITCTCVPFPYEKRG